MAHLWMKIVKYVEHMDILHAYVQSYKNIWMYQTMCSVNFVARQLTTLISVGN